MYKLGKDGKLWNLPQKASEDLFTLLNKPQKLPTLGVQLRCASYFQFSSWCLEMSSNTVFSCFDILNQEIKAELSKFYFSYIQILAFVMQDNACIGKITNLLTRSVSLEQKLFSSLKSIKAVSISQSVACFGSLAHRLFSKFFLQMKSKSWWFFKGL